MKLKLYPYQKETVLETEDFNGRALLALEMGLGKTACALTYALKNKKLPCLVVCPASVKYNWEHEAKNYFGVGSKVLEGRTPPGSVNGLLKMEKIVVINYDILKFWMAYLVKCKFKTVVFDECHFLANRNAQRTKAAQLLARGVPHCLALSGTPLTNRPAELFTSLNMLCPDEFPSFWRFARSYCNPKLTRWGWDYSGASNLQSLHERLAKNCMIRYRKKDVLLDLPDKVRRVIPIELDDADQYYKARDDFLGWLRENHPNRVKRAFKATALARTGDLLRLAAKLKLKGVVGWCNRFLEETDEKLIIFAVHKKCIQVVSERSED
jgi:SWI/SNF-related matrix-associated actin-dependent regulator 1 of chromatin subfamily A